MTGTRKKFVRGISALAVLYVLGGLLLYLLQDLLLFHPAKLERNHRFTFQQPHIEWNVAAGKENLNVVKFLTTAPRKGIVLYFHGNRQNVERYAPFSPLFTRNGYEVWMMDYPGYGKTTGKLTELRIHSDAILLYNAAVSEDGSRLPIIYGKSLGTGVAARLAADRACARLLLETPYYSIPALASTKAPVYPVGLLIKYSFPTYRYLPLVRAPVTMFHGTEDNVVPFKQSLRLQGENPGVQLVVFEGGEHNNLPTFPRFTQVLDSLLRRLTLPGTR